MRLDNEVKLDFADVLIVPQRSSLRSRSEVQLERTFTFLHSGQTWTGVPLAAANMDSTGTFAMACALAEHKMITCLHKHYTVEEWTAFASEHADVLPFVGLSAGTSDADFEKIQTLEEVLGAEAFAAVGFLCLDVANGYSEHFVEHVERVRERFPQKTIIAGNVVTQNMCEELILKGADIVKVGIGPGSVCTTRRQTGVGFPQLSAVADTANGAHGLGGLVMSDGGCTCPGDFSKAFGAGADFVMAGGMFAGHDESGGDLVEVDGRYVKQFYGMSSAVAMKKHAGGVANYRSSEGKAVLLPYRGPVSETVLDLLGGIRSTCTYVGAERLKDLSKRTTFIRVSRQLNTVFGHEERAPPSSAAAPLPAPPAATATGAAPAANAAPGEAKEG